MADTEGICFVASPIGSEGSDTREHADNLLENVIEPAVEPFDLSVERADDIQEQGDITSQIIERIVKSDLVIADLTNSNANVFYELAIRHASEKPYIQLISRNDNLPFDLQNTRTIQYDLNDVPFTNEAIEEIREHIENQFEDDHDEPPDSPVSIGMNLIQMRSSGERDDFEMANILERLSDLQSDINQVQKDINQRNDINRKELKEDISNIYEGIFLEYRNLNVTIKELFDHPNIEQELEESDEIKKMISHIELALLDLEEMINELKVLEDDI